MNNHPPKYAEIKIVNIVTNGKFGFKRFLGYEEINKLILESHFGWEIINPDTTPQLCTYIVREDESRIYIQLWHTGRFYMTGIKTKDEVNVYFHEVLKELKNVVPQVFKNKNGK